MVDEAPPPPATAEEAQARYDAHVAALPPRPDDPERLDEWNNARLYLRKAKFVLGASEMTTNLLALIGNDLYAAHRSMAAAGTNRAITVARGQREEGYHSEIDDSVQPFVRYLPKSYKTGKSLPLLVYLHGYNPDFNLVNWQGIPANLIELAEEEDFLIAAPFGRGNTDYQGVGERDVLAVIREMIRRYGADASRIILIGNSMGATGAWSLAARHPRLFAGAVMISGRGDYYFWHQLDRAAVPAWKRTLIDADFAGSMITNLASLPIYCGHGALDDIVPVEEGRFIAQAVGAVNPGLIYDEIPEGGHYIWDAILEAGRFRAWLLARRLPGPGQPTPEPARPPGVKGALLSPFVFVLADENNASIHTARFRQAVFDWYRYAKAMPRVDWEKSVSSNNLQSCNVFLFGEPETSGLIRQVLERSPVQVTARSFIVEGRAYPRRGNGLYLAQPSPWNPEKVAVVQCGLHWGEGVWENHKYDFLPDYIVYTARADDDGSNKSLCAGFFDAQWRMTE